MAQYIKVAFVTMLLTYASLAEASGREIAFFPDVLGDDRPGQAVPARAGAGDVPAADTSWASEVGSSISHIWSDYISPVGILKDMGGLAVGAYQAVKAEVGRNVIYAHRVYTESTDVASFWHSCRRAEVLPTLPEELIQANKARKDRIYKRVQTVAIGSIFLLGLWAHCTPIQPPVARRADLFFDSECGRACNGAVICSLSCFHT